MSVPTLIRTSLVLIKLMLMPRSARAANMRAAAPVWVRIPTPMTDSLARCRLDRDVGNARSLDCKGGTLGRIARHGERKHRIALDADVLNDHIDEDARFGDRTKNVGRIAGPVGHPEQRDARLRLVQLDPLR